MLPKIKRVLYISFALLLLLMFIRVYKISDISMNYTLTDGDLVIVENFSAGMHIPSLFFYAKGHIFSNEQGIRRGDLMAFKHPLDNRLYLKRVVARPGDKVFQRDKNFYLQIEADQAKTVDFARQYNIELEKIADEYWLRNPYSTFYHIVHVDDISGPDELINYPITVIPDHKYFFLGDFRDNSTDSRFFGPVDYDEICYEVWIIIRVSEYLKKRALIKPY